MKETRFKDTEIGRIPVDWEIKEIGNVCNTSSGGTPSRSNPSFYEGNIPWITTGELKDCYINDSKEHITESAVANSSAKIVPEGTLLMAMYGATIGKLGIINIPSATNQACCAITPKEDDMKYLFYKLLFDRANLISKGCGAGQPNISQAIIKELKYPFPSKHEQSRIASALTSIDNLISSLDKLIEKKKNIKQGTMQQLLTGKKRLKGFTEPWDYVTLGQVGYFEGHSVNPSQYPNDAFTEYSMPAFDAGQSPNTLQGFEMLSSRVSIDGEVLLINKLNVRQKRIWHIKNCESNAVCSGEFLPYKSEKLNLSFLRHLMLTDKVVQDFMDMSTGTSNSQKRVRPINVLNYKIYIPVDRNEQYAIASFLDSLDNEIISIRAKKNKYESLKQGMMQQLLTGKIRLV